MDYLVPFLFWVHMVSLALGGVAVFGIPVVGARMGSAPPEVRPVLAGIANSMSTVGRTGLALLLISGPIMFWLKFGWVAPNVWFWVKMVLVAVILVTVVFAGINAKRAQGGDMAAAKLGPRLGMLAMVLYLIIIGSAVLSFA